MEKARNTRARSLYGWLGAPLAVAVLVLFFFDPSQFHFYPVCIFHQTTGLLCPGCGGLRAAHRLLHGDFYAAFRFNPLVVLGFPFLLSWLALVGWRNAGALPFSSSSRAVWFGLVPFLMLSLLFAVWRNLPGSLLALPG